MIESHPGIPLKKHLEEVKDLSLRYFNQKSLNFSVTSKEEVVDVVKIIAYAHDFGKCTSYFQNLLKHGQKNANTHHSLISALFGYVILQKIYGRESIWPEIGLVVIRCHHGSLKSPGEPFSMFKNSIYEQFHDLNQESRKEKIVDIYRNLFTSHSLTLETIFDDLAIKIEEFREDYRNEFERQFANNWRNKKLSHEERIEAFLLCNLLFSLLIDSDKKCAGKYDIDRFDDAEEPIIDINEFIDFKRSKEPEKFNLENPLNKKRSEFYSEVVEHPGISRDKKIYTITAPTGIGKTFTAFGLAFRLRKMLPGNRKIIYSLPFTSIIDQNYSEIETVMEWSMGEKLKSKPGVYIFKHHHLSSVLLESNENNDSNHSIDFSSYIKNQILHESWDSGIVISTFVQLFESLIGVRNKWLKKFHNITNGVIILDEIQNLPPEYHKLIGEIFQILAERFDTYIIFMTATQPNIIDAEKATSLVDTEKYFNHEIFNRVNVSLLNNLESLSHEDILNHVENNHHEDSFLFVCNTKRCTIELFNNISAIAPEEAVCICLTTLQTPRDREKWIKIVENKLVEDRQVICISTQLIEAGVDLSFPVVYRDLGPLDSIIQVAGRCNRHGEMADKGQLYVTSLINDNNNEYATRVYDSKLINATKSLLLEKGNIFDSSDFLNMSRQYFKRFDFEYLSKRHLNAIANLEYTSSQGRDSTPVKKFQLIENRPKELDVVICENQKDQEILDNLFRSYQKLKNSSLHDDEYQNTMGYIKYLRKELAEITISVYDYMLDDYIDAMDLAQNEELDIYYVPHKYFLENRIYKEDIGWNINADSDDTTNFVAF